MGLYYYGARYLDAKYSRWLSIDPAVSDYVSGTSAGEGGIYNTVNFSLYHYAGNNPVKYTDPTGMSLDDWQDNGDGTWTVKSEGAKLWDVWGADRQEKSGFDRDPRTLQVGETVGKKNEEQRAQKSMLEVTNEESTVSSAANVDISPWKTWWAKPAGEPLTDAEAKIQRRIGIYEMITGPLLGAIGAESTQGKSVLPGYYLMADGAVIFADGQDKRKTIPGLFFIKFLNPIVGDVDGIPIITDYTWPLPTR